MTEYDCAPDCDERDHCPKPGTVGHLMCGHCDDCNKPVHHCGHTPTPARVTLTDDEQTAIIRAIACPGGESAAEHGPTPWAALGVVETLLAAREAAVRAQIEDRLHDAADELGALIDEQHSAAANPDAWLRDSIARIVGGDQ